MTSTDEKSPAPASPAEPVLSEHQLRVFQEEAELHSRLEALERFIGGEVFKSLAPWERRVLKKQARAMRDYADALYERIINWRWLREHRNGT